MRPLKVNGVVIDDTFAEAFGMRATAIIITAPNRKWARQAAISMTGFATSVIACGCEAAIDVELPPSATPDGRPGVRVMLFSVSTDELQKQLVEPCRPMRAHLARQRLLRRPVRPDRAEARRGAALFRRWLADIEKARRQTLLARAGDGR